MPRAPGTVTVPLAVGTPFDSGALCLDLVYTGGPGDLSRWERLHTAADLSAWLRDGPLRLPVGAADDDDLVAALRLREHLRVLLTAAATGAALPPDPVTAVNAAAAQPPPVPVLRGDRTVGWATPVTVPSVLSLLARDALDVLGRPSSGRLKECAAHDCPLMFLDDSGAGARRWCSMQRCGNRSKVRAQRARTRPGATGAAAPGLPSWPS
jgi:predicted RNA-binding Zn ribbon-like protein